MRSFVDQFNRMEQSRAPITTTIDDKDTLQSLFVEDWEFQLADNPCFASQSGNHAYDNRLQDLSPEAFDRRLAHNKKILKLLNDEFVRKYVQAQSTFNVDLTPADIAMFKQSVADETKALELGCHLFPVNSIGYGGVHYNFIEALDWLDQSDPNKRDANLVARLTAFPQQCEQYKNLLRLGIQKNRVASKAMLRKVPEQLRASQRPQNLVSMINSIQNSALKVRGQIALNSFETAIRGLIDFFETEYVPRARERPGCCGMADGIGSDLYALCLRFHTTT